MKYFIFYTLVHYTYPKSSIILFIVVIIITIASTENLRWFSQKNTNFSNEETKYMNPST